MTAVPRIALEDIIAVTKISAITWSRWSREFRLLPAES